MSMTKPSGISPRPNPEQSAAAELMARRVVNGDATEAEMDFIRWFVELTMPFLRFDEREHHRAAFMGDEHLKEV